MKRWNKSKSLVHPNLFLFKLFKVCIFQLLQFLKSTSAGQSKKYKFAHRLPRPPLQRISFCWRRWTFETAPYSAIEYNVRLLWGFTQKWSAISYDMDTGAWTSGKYLKFNTESKSKPFPDNVNVLSTIHYMLSEVYLVANWTFYVGWFPFCTEHFCKYISIGIKYYTQYVMMYDLHKHVNSIWLSWQILNFKNNNNM